MIWKHTFYVFMTKRKTRFVKFVTMDFLKKRIKHTLRMSMRKRKISNATFVILSLKIRNDTLKLFMTKKKRKNSNVIIARKLLGKWRIWKYIFHVLRTKGNTRFVKFVTIYFLKKENKTCNMTVHEKKRDFKCDLYDNICKD